MEIIESALLYGAVSASLGERTPRRRDIHKHAVEFIELALSKAPKDPAAIPMIVLLSRIKGLQFDQFWQFIKILRREDGKIIT